MKTLEQKIAVMQAALEGKKICYIQRGFKEQDVRPFIALDPITTIVWDWQTFDYNIYEEPKTKPSIDWPHVHPDFNYLATEDTGDTYLYEMIPSACDDGYWGVGGLCALAISHASFKPGTCDWKDSLVERPK